MTVRDQWDRLDPETQKWLTDNPGRLILPHTITAVICKESTGEGTCDQHGQMVLTEEDRGFIQAKARQTRPGVREYRFHPADQS
jgi:hypothetical protein